jgi:thiol:disulfide interchange protein DsbD
MKQILSLFLTIGYLFAQTNPVTMLVEPTPKFRAGEVAEIVISMNMDDEWHIYSIFKTSADAGPLPTELSVGGNAVGMVAPVIEPEPIHAFDPGFETDTYYHKGNTQFTVPVKLKRNLQPGTYKIAVDVFYMVCNARLCYPPITKTDTVVVEIEAGSPRADKVSFAVATSSPNDSGPMGKSNSLLGIFLLAVGGAILSWVMPCVYPMIPIIISFFGKMSEEKHIGKNAIASFYGLGISGTFVLIGILVGFLSWGVSDVAAQSRYANIGNFIATNSWINLGLGILFIFFALWMFGIINVNVAGTLLNKTDQAGQSAKSAYLGSFLLGITFAITSFSCTVPVVGSLLVVAAAGTADGLLTSVFGMVIYGVVFAAPFVALSLFPKALDRLPSSGSWMETIKIVFGFIEIAAAVKFLWVPDLEWELGILPRNVVLAIFILIGILQIGYLFGFYTIGSAEKIKPFQIGKGRVIGILLTGMVLFPIGMSLASPPTYHYAKMPRVMEEFIEAMVPPPPTEDAIAIREGWFVDQYDDALAKAKLEGKPLFIDFTGVYCANCRVMERRIFPMASVKEEFDKMILVRLYVDKKDSLSEAYAQLQFERYQQATQPYYVVLDPEDEYTLVDTGGYIPNGFSDFLIEGLSAFDARKSN